MYLTSLVLVLSVFVGLTGCDDPEIKSIRKTYLPTKTDQVEKAIELLQEYRQIFKEGAQNSAQRLDSGSGNVFQTIDDAHTLSDAYSTYAQNLQTIDVSECPADFQARFKNYVQSETKMANIFKRVANMDIPAKSEGDRAKQNVDASLESLKSLVKQKYGISLD